MKLMKRVFLSFFLFLFTLPTAFAQEGDVIHDFDVEVSVAADGKIKVLEKIQYEFGPGERHGIYRYVPTVYGDDELLIPLKFQSVTDENGYPYNYEITNRYYSTNVKIGDADVLVSGSHWYYIEYESAFVVQGYNDHDEFYWNVTGNDWDVPIENVSAQVTVPAGGTMDFKYATCYAGAFGDKAKDCNAEVVDDNTFKFSANNGLGYGNGFTIVAAFEKGLVALPAFLKVNSDISYGNVYVDGEFIGSTGQMLMVMPGQHSIELKSLKYNTEHRQGDFLQEEKTILEVELKKQSLWIFIDDYLPYILFIVGLLLFFRLWFMRGRDPEGRGTIMPFYKPTDDLSPGEMGVLVDELANLRDISASIVHLAVKGCLRIEKKEDKKYDFVKLKEAGSDVLPFEKKILEALFGSGDKISTDELQKTFFLSLGGIKDELYDQLVEKKYFDVSPDKVRKHYLWRAFAFFLFVSFISGFMLLFFASFLYKLLPLLGVISFVFAFIMPRKTQLGVEVYERILGYKMFLTTAEKDRIEKLFSPEEYADAFEKNLPYAMVLKVEKKWAKHFKGIYDGVPDWYTGTGILNLNAFMYDLGDFQMNTATAFSGITSGSGGGSGFGGGGFSGGGFGGGGGGSW